jgi:hypothetical protein
VSIEIYRYMSIKYIDMCQSRYIDASIELYRYRSIDMYQSRRLITQLQFNYVVEIECRYGSMSHLRNYIFVEGSCFSETNISLGGVA